MGEVQADLDRITVPWSDEIARALRERTAWGHLGRLDVSATNRGRATLGGFIDRRLVPVDPGRSGAQALDAWRKTPDGRITDRVVVQANLAFVQRLAPASRTVQLADPWLDELGAGDGAVVVVGNGSDLVQVARATRASPLAARVHSCATEQRPGVVAAVTGGGISATVVAMVSATQGPGGLYVITVLEIKARMPPAIRRLDVVV